MFEKAGRKIFLGEGREEVGWGTTKDRTGIFNLAKRRRTVSDRKKKKDSKTAFTDSGKREKVGEKPGRRDP